MSDTDDTRGAARASSRRGELQTAAAVCCSRCSPPQRVEVPAGVFYRLKDHELISCPNGHQGTLQQYKQAASEMAVAHGPFIRYDPHPADWLSREARGL